MCISDCPDSQSRPSQRLLSPRAITEIEYGLYELCYHVHLYYYIKGSSKDLSPVQILSKSCVCSDGIFPTFLSLFHALKPNTTYLPPQQIKTETTRQFFLHVGFSKATKQGGISVVVYHVEEGISVPCSSRQVAMHPGTTPSTVHLLGFNTGSVILLSCAFMF